MVMSARTIPRRAGRGHARSMTSTLLNPTILVAVVTTGLTAGFLASVQWNVVRTVTSTGSLAFLAAALLRVH